MSDTRTPVDAIVVGGGIGGLGLLRGQLGREDGGEEEDADHDSGMAGGDRRGGT